MRRAYSYIRFSSAKQAEGDSLRRQLEGSTRVCKREGWFLDDSLNLRDLGVSAFRGTNVKEGALAAFLEAVRSGRVPKGSVLLVESLDRLSRDAVWPALNVFMCILQAGVSIYTFNPDRHFLPGKADALTLIEPLIIFSRAHEESLTKSERVQAAWNEKRKNAATKPMTGKCPGWLKLTEKGFVEVKPAADTVRRIFKMRLDGLGVRRITKALVEQGVKPFGRSGRWTETYVHKILTWRAVFGEAQRHVTKDGKQVPTGEPLPNYYPTVVLETDFYAVQAMMASAQTQATSSPPPTSLTSTASPGEKFQRPARRRTVAGRSSSSSTLLTGTTCGPCSTTT